MDKTVLLIATHDTKEQEALYLKTCIESNGAQTMVMDTGILASPQGKPDISQDDVAEPWRHVVKRCHCYRRQT